MPQRRSTAVRKLTPTLDRHDGEGRMLVVPHLTSITTSKVGIPDMEVRLSLIQRRLDYYVDRTKRRQENSAASQRLSGRLSEPQQFFIDVPFVRFRVGRVWLELARLPPIFVFRLIGLGTG